jgi:DNA polymerase-3 subunit delta'
MTDIIGHADILDFLSRAAEQNRLNPSLLFAGPDGVGKKTVAMHTARLLNCEMAGDFLLIDKAFQAALLKEKPESQNTIKIESVRHLDRFLRLKAGGDSCRVCVIEDADKLSEEAANALLKILEEPPARTQIILIASFERNMLPTILSRCAVLRFRPLPAPKIAVWLEKNKAVSQQEAENAAARCDGSLGRAIKILDEASFGSLDDVSVAEYFISLSDPSWRKEGRLRAVEVVRRLTEDAQARLEKGDISQTNSLKALFHARKQLDRYAPPRLVLESLFVKLKPVFK